jgi:hypothetical protein
MLDGYVFPLTTPECKLIDSPRNAYICTLHRSTTRGLTLTIQAAKLRLPTALSDEIIGLIVEQTIDELGLRDAAETVVGGPLRKGISGGEKRYVIRAFHRD